MLSMLREYATLLRQNRNYRYLWLGYVVSQLGDWFNLIASALLVAQITDTGTSLSYLFLARFLPLFLFSPFAGVLADRYNRRNILIASDLLRALTVLGFLLIREPSQLWLFYLLTITQFMLSSLFTPARSAVLANVVRKEELVAANALDSLTWSTMLALGAFLGGVATTFLGITAGFILDSLTFVVSAILLLGTAHSAGEQRARRSGRQSPLEAFFEFIGGFQYLWRHPLLLCVALVKGGGALIWGAVNVFEVVYAEEFFPLQLTLNGQTYGADGSIALGAIYIVSGLGTGLGPLVARRWLGDSIQALRWGILVGFALLSIGLSMLGLSPTLGVFAFFTFVRTVGSGVLWVFSAALLQMLIPDDVRGRVFAFEFAFLTLTQSISIYFAGVALDLWAFPLPEATIGFGLLGIGVTLLWGVFHLLTRFKPLTPVTSA